MSKFKPFQIVRSKSGVIVQVCANASNFDCFSGVRLHSEANNTIKVGEYYYAWTASQFEPIESDMTESFKVGDRVECSKFGMIGVVSMIRSGDDYNVCVKFSDGSERLYTHDGSHYINDPITLRKLAAWKPTEGEVCLFRDDEYRAWSAMTFLEMDGSKYASSGFNMSWRYCRPFSLELVGKTDNPPY